MSISIELPECGDIDVDFNMRLRYSMWCSKNLHVEGEARTWKIYKPDGYWYRIVFYHEEDATAFKLRFGL